VVATHLHALCGSIYFGRNPQKPRPGRTALNPRVPPNVKAAGKTLDTRRVDAFARTTIFHLFDLSQCFTAFNIVGEVERKSDEIHSAESKENALLRDRNHTGEKCSKRQDMEHEIATVASYINYETSARQYGGTAEAL
jgi:hypothetical protein